jgi:hypothetical protein
VPGEGVLARYGSLILLSSLEHGPLVDMLLDLLEQTAAAGGDGRQFADQVAAVIESADAGDGGAAPSVLAFGAAGSGVAMTVSGGAWADVTTAHGTQRIAAGQPGMLLRCVLRSPASMVNGGLSAGINGPASTDRFSRLDAGTVRANGLSYYAGGGMTGGYVYQPPALAAQPAPAPPQVVVPPPQPVAPPPTPAAPVGQLAMPAQPEGYIQPPPPPPVQPPPVQPPPVQQAVPPQPPVPAPPQPVAPPPPADQAGTELWQPPPSPAQSPPVQSPPVQPPPGLPGGLPPGGAPPFAQNPEPFESVLLLDAVAAAGGADLGVEQRAPLARARDVPPGTSSYSSEAPIIQGVYCKNGHFDDPEALFCAVCGISMNQQTLINRPGTRPPLGVLLLDDGSVFQLDRDYIVGREPGLDATVASGRSRPLRIADDSGIVSRVHAKVALDGWRVLVTDLGSANGTRVRLPKNGGEQVLQPHQPFVLSTGSQIDLGGRGFRYESHRGR